jgi:hypothetical protein
MRWFKVSGSQKDPLWSCGIRRIERPGAALQALFGDWEGWLRSNEAWEFARSG